MEHLLSLAKVCHCPSQSAADVIRMRSAHVLADTSIHQQLGFALLKYHCDFLAVPSQYSNIPTGDTPVRHKYSAKRGVGRNLKLRCPNDAQPALYRSAAPLDLMSARYTTALGSRTLGLRAERPESDCRRPLGGRRYLGEQDALLVEESEILASTGRARRTQRDVRHRDGECARATYPRRYPAHALGPSELGLVAHRALALLHELDDVGAQGQRAAARQKEEECFTVLSEIG